MKYMNIDLHAALADVGPQDSFPRPLLCNNSPKRQTLNRAHWRDWQTRRL